jgi:ribonuclease HI
MASSNKSSHLFPLDDPPPPVGPLKTVQLITDGACIGNPGPGGWACILRYGSHQKELYGSEKQTTNNRMELTAAVEGLRALKEPCEVEVVTDSEYLKNGITAWIQNWKRNGWRTKEGKPVVNQDLWAELDKENLRHRTRWTWTKGHASHADNNRCDELATAAARNQSRTARG